MVSCKHLYFRYSRKTDWILDDFSHEFTPGIHLIKGYSGCGKSTLLRLMGGYLKPKKGKISLGDIAKKPTASFQRKHLGFVFQQLNLLPLASVKRNLSLSASLGGVSGSELKKRSDQYLEKLGLEDYKKRLPGSMSGGQQQRATIARALIKEPAVLLLDEPTSGLDDLNTTVISNVLREFVSGADNRVAIICTHDQRLDEIADDILDFNQFLPVERHLEALV